MFRVVEENVYELDDDEVDEAIGEWEGFESYATKELRQAAGLRCYIYLFSY